MPAHQVSRRVTILNMWYMSELILMKWSRSVPAHQVSRRVTILNMWYMSELDTDEMEPFSACTPGF